MCTYDNIPGDQFEILKVFGGNSHGVISSTVKSIIKSDTRFNLDTNMSDVTQSLNEIFILVQGKNLPLPCVEAT